MESSAIVFDQHVAFERVEGDKELLQEIVELFFEETPEMLSVIRESIARGDSKALEQAAHSLKGAVSSFGAQAARDAALRLETVGRIGDLANAAQAFAELEKEVARLARVLTVLRGEQAS